MDSQNQNIEKIRQYMMLKKEISEQNKIIKSYRVVQKELEKKILDFLLKNDIDELDLGKKNMKIVVNKKEKKEAVNKKYIEKRCLEFVNGDVSQAKNLIGFIYDKESRPTVLKKKLKNPKIKKK